MPLLMFVQDYADYHAWATTALLNSLKEMDNPPERALELMRHIIATDRTYLDWLRGATAESPDRGPRPHELAGDWEEVLEAWRALLGSLGSDEALMEWREYPHPRGDLYRVRVLDALLQPISHGTHHRGQIAGGIRDAGGTPPMLDYIWYKVGRSGRAPRA